MSVQQITGVVLLFVGLGALSVSVGVAWILSRLARDGRVDGTWFISVVSLLLFLVGIALCWFGVSAIVEGSADASALRHWIRATQNESDRLL